MTRLRLLAPLYLRLALAAAFLSAVADRFGLWGANGASGVAWGDFAHFQAYTAHLLPFLPEPLVGPAAWTATGAEVLLALALLVGYRVRVAAGASAVLLLLFALGMILGDGIKSPLDASVFSASAGALLLSVSPRAASREPA